MLKNYNMASVRLYRKKIKSAKNIAKITKAMQMVAASKMKRAQLMAESSRDYSDGVLNLSNIISSRLDPLIHPLLMSKLLGSQGEMALLIAPEKGLCGGLLTNTARYIAKLYSPEDLKNLKFVAIGKKAKYIINRIGGNIIADFEIGLSQPSYDIVAPISHLISESFIKGDVGKVSVFYNEFVNTMTQKPSRKTLLPLTMRDYEEKDAVQNMKNTDMIFEPSARDITDSLLERYLEIEVYQFLLDAYASEQSARMVAMKNATDNAKGLISDLTIKYNKVRQAGITAEIIDIASASMILE